MIFLRQLLFISLLCSGLGFFSACATNNSPEMNESLSTSTIKREGGAPLRLQINGTDFQIDTEKTVLAEQLQKILPEKFTMHDLNQNEKYYELPQAIPVQAEQVGKVEVGDVLLFGEKTLVIFYQSFETNYSYTKIGRIRQREKLAEQLGSGSVVVERN